MKKIETRVGDDEQIIMNGLKLPLYFHLVCVLDILIDGILVKDMKTHCLSFFIILIYFY